MPLINYADRPEHHSLVRTHVSVGKRAQQRKNFRDNTRYDRKVAKLTQPRPNGFGN